MVPEAGASKIKVLADWVSGQSLLPGSSAAVFLLYSHLVGAFWGLFCKDTHPIHGSFGIMISSPPQSPPSIFQPTGNSISTYEFWGTRSVSNTAYDLLYSIARMFLFPQFTRNVS